MAILFQLSISLSNVGSAKGELNRPMYASAFGVRCQGICTRSKTMTFSQSSTRKFNAINIC